MSTKTLHKRIALVAVATLGAGLLSVAPANATGLFVTAGIRVNGTAIVAPTGTANDQTVTIGATSSVTVTAVAGTDEEAKFTVTGGTITGSSLATDKADGTSTPTSFVYGNTVAQVTFTPNAGESIMYVYSYTSSAAATAGTIAATLKVTIKSGAVGVISPADSFVSVVDAATVTDPTNNVDVAAAKTVADGTNGRINFVLKDANGVAMADSAVVTATSSAGCVVAATNSTTAYLSGSVSTAYGTADEVFVARAVSKTAASCTITMTVNGVALGTKTIVLQGKVTKLTVLDGQADIANAYASASTSADAFAYNAFDAAGNVVYGITPTFNDTPSAAFASTSLDVNAVITVGYGLGNITCTGAARGSGTFYLSYVNSAGETIKSPVYTANCFGNAYTYTASLDKVSYVPGDIATLTINAKDKSGNPANDYVYLGGTVAAGTGTTNAPSIAGSNMTAITAATSTDMFYVGKKTYKFVVGSTEGSYQMSVDLPKFNSSITPQSAVTVAYKIAGNGGVSNADVLKAIVSLIASINKQIAALQKALLKK